MSASGLRKAAVLLAGLHPLDQAWILEKLQPSWRYDLRCLIGQVESMEMVDSDIARVAIHTCGNEEPPQPPSPDRLLAGMRGLSPSWCARVLAACTPDHVEVFAANSTSEEAGAVRAELSTLPRIPSKLAETLAHIVRERGERAMPSSLGEMH